MSIQTIDVLIFRSYFAWVDTSRYETDIHYKITSKSRPTGDEIRSAGVVKKLSLCVILISNMSSPNSEWLASERGIGFVKYGWLDNINSGKKIAIAKIYLHPAFDNITGEADLAIVKLAEELKLNVVHSWPIELAPYNYTPLPGTVLTVSGWGAIRDNGPESDRLRKTNVTVVSPSDCQKMYEKDQQIITQSMICANNLSQKSDSCNGDSGRPLILMNGTVPVQVGIVSFGRKCASPFFPAVYTNVGYYRNFIEKFL
ncbi:mite allergen Der p 3-like [Oppia nitens]|uniref:mite allergen Der p 3-like n=1 Tax=Oppia nitens TaxID=1686743 RepID=UPI0023DB18A4|nr:mite allergen Der p 3-like [Oppia nitens]